MGWQRPDSHPDFAMFICADFNHTLEIGDAKFGMPDHRVGAADLTILATWWHRDDVPADCMDF
jgi:hypothetical protein